jgi:hypothetical protein
MQNLKGTHLSTTSLSNNATVKSDPPIPMSMEEYINSKLLESNRTIEDVVLVAPPSSPPKLNPKFIGALLGSI